MTHGDDAIAISGRLAINRRTMMRLGGLAVAGLAAGAAAAPAAYSGDVRFVVSDRRHPDSLRFAEALEREGAVRLEAGDGLTRLWQSVLQPHWRARPGATAGLTSVAIWQLLAEQARGEGRRATLIARHRIDPEGGGAVHLVTVPNELAEVAAPLWNAPGNWPVVAAHLVSRCSARSATNTATRRCGALTPADASHPSLVSWRIG